MEYYLTNELWRLVLLSPAVGTVVFAVLWVFVRQRSKKVKNAAVAVSVLAPLAVGMFAILATSAGDLGDWVMGLGGLLFVGVCGYLMANSWDVILEHQRAALSEDQAERQRAGERRAWRVFAVAWAIVVVASTFFALA